MNEMNEIIQAALVKYPKAKKIAVKNVSVWYRGTWEDSMNLHNDMNAYKWNNDTMKAILFVYTKTKQAQAITNKQK